MLKLAESSGVVVHESGTKLFISKRPGAWTSTSLFVTGLLAFILLVNGVLQLTILKDQVNGSSKLGMILIGSGLLISLFFWRIRVYRKKLNALSPEKLENILVFDLGTNQLLDDQQNILSPLQQVSLARKFQFGSSSPELIVQWDQGYRSIVKGNPFSGGISAIENVLLNKGIKKR